MRFRAFPIGVCLRSGVAPGLFAFCTLLVAAGVGSAPTQDRIPASMALKDGALVPLEALRTGAEPATGLQKPFPPIVTRPDNPTTPERVELGRLLFFDPVLSGDNQMSCAHCHHPNLSFSDGLPHAKGFGSAGAGAARGGGVDLPRRTPSLWNALYNHRQYWDGRAIDLEDQAQFPITDPNEMGGKKEEVERKLRAIPEYRQRFDRAFGGKEGDGITFTNVTKAIAAFERTLVSLNSRYDRYAAGDTSALALQEVRGLKLFLSTKLRCAECHGLPTFANRDFKVVGLPDTKDGPPDPQKPNAEPGRGGGVNGAFKIPSLRNVSLRAPYMHNGSLKTLDDVLEFYEHGGGRGKGLNVPLQDDKIRKYRFLPGEKGDLIAFLDALTDTSAIPAIPRRVPSGLPVIPHVAMRAQNAPKEPTFVPPIRPALTVEVHAGESIQAAVEKAGRGGTVRVYPGVYPESVLVIQHGVTLVGVAQNGQRPILDGRGVLSDAVIAMGNRFTMQGFAIRDFVGNGVLARGLRQVTFRDLTVSNPGTYAVYPVECDGVLIERCVVSGAKDAGLYVGQSRHIVVRQNEVFRNVAGIEIENSVDSRVEHNFVHDNTGGILVFVLPFNPSKVCEQTTVAHNRVLRNNTPNFADPNAIVHSVMEGTGILILGADRTTVTENEVADNKTLGIAVAGLGIVFPPKTRYDVDPNPDGNRIENNRLKNNGSAPDPRLKALGVPGRDLIWDLTGKGNLWNQPGANAFPNRLPKAK